MGNGGSHPVVARPSDLQQSSGDWYVFPKCGPLVGGAPASFCFPGGCGKKEPFPRPWKCRKSERTLPGPSLGDSGGRHLDSLSDSAASFCPRREEIKQAWQPSPGRQRPSVKALVQALP